MSQGRFLILILAVAIVHLTLAMTIAPLDDELYYWCWSKDLQASYFDHPPMTAYLIRLSTSVFGDTLLGVRFFACLSTTGILLLTGQLTRRRGIGWLLLTPMVALGSIVMTPDAPLLFFWTAYAAWLVKMQDGAERRAGMPDVRRAFLPDAWKWAVAGLLLGLGGLSKYTMALAVPGAFLSFALRGDRGGRSWLWGFAGHLLVAVAVVTPVLMFNSWHDFAPLRYQLNHAARTADSGFDPSCVFEYLGCQLALIGALPFFLLPWCLSQRRALAGDDRLRVCLWLFLFPSSFFLLKGTVGHVEGNWPIICYMTLLPLGLHWYDQLPEGTWKRWSFRSAFLAPAGVTAFLFIHVFLHLPIPSSIDRVAKSQARFDSVHQVAEWARAEGVGKIYGVNYQLTSQLRFQQIASNQLPGLCRPSHFTMRPEHWDAEKDLLVLWHLDLGWEPPVLPTTDFQPPQVLVSFPELIEGTRTADYVVVRYERRVRPAPDGLTAIPSRQSELVRLR